MLANTPSKAARNVFCTVSAGMISPSKSRSIVAQASAIYRKNHAGDGVGKNTKDSKTGG